MMKFELQGGALYEAIGTVAPASKNSVAQPIIKTVRIVVIEGESSTIEFHCTDLSMSIQTTRRCRSAKSGSICLPADLLMRLAAKLQREETVMFSLAKGKSLRVKIQAGEFSSTVTGMDPNAFPPPAKIDEPDAQFLMTPSEVDELSSKLGYATSQEKSRFELDGIRFEISDGVLQCIATDGRRLVVRNYGNKEDIGVETGAVVSSRTIAAIKGIFHDEVKIAIAGRKVKFESQNSTLVASCLVDNFPQWHRIVPDESEYTNSFTLDRLATIDAVERASLFCDQDSKVLVVHHDGNGVVFHGDDQGAGRDGSATVSVEGGAPIEARVNCKFLHDIVRSMYSDRVRFRFRKNNGERSPVMIDGDGDPGLLVVLMPMRPPDNDEEEKKEEAAA